MPPDPNGLCRAAAGVFQAEVSVVSRNGIGGSPVLVWKVASLLAGPSSRSHPAENILREESLD
jgi:hypothetical protein